MEESKGIIGRLEAFRLAGNVDPETGHEYENDIDFIQCEILGFCGCGIPDDNVRYVRDVLTLIGEKSPDDMGKGNENFSKWFKDWDARMIKTCGNENAKYFAFYFFDKMGWTEHGGSVPGWLTDAGKEILEDLNKIKFKE